MKTILFIASMFISLNSAVFAGHGVVDWIRVNADHQESKILSENIDKRCRLALNPDDCTEVQERKIAKFKKVANNEYNAMLRRQKQNDK